MKLNTILRKSQKDLKKALMWELTALGYTPLSRDGFLYAEGDIPVLLVAHLDTVHHRNVKTICTSHDGAVLMSPEGIGGDDRAGVYMVLQLAAKVHCHVLFCEDEEVGGVGARKFTRSGIRPRINYIVELDRHGARDAVYYDCANEKFIEFVQRFGFHEAIGSFSDISILAPYLDVAAVNLSTGYYDEHTLHERIDMRVVERNIKAVHEMLVTPTEPFDYVPLFWGVESIMVSPLPDGSYVVAPNGEYYDAFDAICVDAHGALYYVMVDGGAIRLTEYQAYNKCNLPVRFTEEQAFLVELLD